MAKERMTAKLFHRLKLSASVETVSIFASMGTNTARVDQARPERQPG
jgi:hypothetical protein